MNAWIWRGVSIVSVAAVLGGCPKKSTVDADAAVDAAPVTSAVEDAAPPAPLGANEADVKRYGDETKIDHVAAQVAWYVASIRSAASSGAPLVAVVKKGAETTKIAQEAGFFLVTFTDPGTPGRTLVGWIDQKAYSPQIWDAGKHFITCPKGEVAILLDSGEQCVVPCSSTNDQCVVGQVCDGDAPKSNQGQAGDNVEFCRVGNKKGGGSPALLDAGPSLTTDAGGAAKDAGPATASHAAYHIMPGVTTCNPGFVKAGGFCRWPCKTPADCPAKAACKSFQGNMLCQDNN